MKYIFVLYLGLLISLPDYICAQCTSTGVKDPADAVNDPTCGTLSWSSPTNANASDNNRATVTAVALGDITKYLKATDFGFSIPNGSTICGISVGIEKSAFGLLSNITDNSVKIVRNDSVMGDDKASGSAWYSSDQNVTYGGSNDTWGVSWTPDQVNASGFGVSISASINGVAVLPTARIDYINITVYYNPGSLPVHLLHFDAVNSTGLVNLSWATASENQSDFYTIYKYRETGWEEIGRVKGVGTSCFTHEYTYNYHSESTMETSYMLEETDLNGASSVLQITRAVSSIPVYSFKVTPNPTNGYIQVQSPGEYIKIYSLEGKMVRQLNTGSADVLTMDISALPKGLYLLSSSYGKWQRVLLE